MTTPTLTLDVYACAARRSYNATFTGPRADEVAAAFIAERSATHAFALPLCADCAAGDGHYDDEPCVRDLDAFPLVMDALYPTCEHGMDGRLCAGPGHYPMDR